jgi:hypothetical protein
MILSSVIEILSFHSLYKAYGIPYDIDIPSFPEILHQLSLNSKVNKLPHLVQIRISSSYWQLSEVITPQLLIVSRYVNNCWKSEKPLYIFYVELHVRFWS